MPIPTVITAPVPGLEQALADAIRSAKTDDPLAPVTVLVGGTLLRPYLQRRMATLLGGHANVAFVTAAELAVQLGEQQVVADGRRPMPPLAARILAGEVARDTPGYFEPVAHTTGFTNALHRVLRELTQAGVSAAQFAQAVPDLPGTRAKHEALAALYAGYEAKRSGWYGPDECLLAADPRRLDTNLLVLHGVWELSGALQHALSDIAKEVPVLVLLPEGSESGHHGGLVSTSAWADGIGATIAQPPEDERDATLLRHVQDHVLRAPLNPHPPTADGTVQLVSAPDPTREVRAAARACLEWAAAGIPFHRMAIASRHADTYRPLVDSVFREAGIPVYLHEGTPLGEMPLGRRILGVLDVIDSGLERRVLVDLLSDADLPEDTRDRYPGFSPTRWDTLSRTAGIVGGIEQWRDRLEQLRIDREQRLSEDGSDAPDWLIDEIERITSLGAFVNDLDAALNELPERASFGEHLEALERLLATYVSEVEPVLVALRSLARLDGITENLPFERFRDIVRSAIDGMRSDAVLGRRAGAFGRRGVNVLDVNSLRHLRFDAVVLLGLVERSWPSPVRQDPILLDRERAALSDATGAPLALRVLGGDPEPLQFIVAVQSATHHLQASYPRSDRAGGRAQLPSSFLRGLASAAIGQTVTAEHFDQLPTDLLRRERAAQAGVPSGQPALSESERRRSLLEHEETAVLGRALLRQDERFARADQVERARASRELTVFDGALSPDVAEELLAHWSITRPMAPTSLEGYAGCGMQFFLGRVLGVKTIEEPEAILTIDALTKGSLVHRVLERFMSELGTTDWPQASKRKKHLKRLLDIGAEECDGVEERGLTGYPMLWAADRRRVLEDLERWYDAEAERGNELPQRSYELRVGPVRRGETDPNPLSTDEPLTLEIDGREVRIQARIDRVEWDPGSGRFRIIDYKTGRVWTKDGDIAGGKSLQLPLYVRAAAHALSLDPADGDGEYFYITRDGGFTRVAFTRDDLAEQHEWVDHVLATLVSSVTSGVFAARPAEERECGRCAFDALCDSRRMAQKQRKSRDPRVARLDALREGRVA